MIQSLVPGLVPGLGNGLRSALSRLQTRLRPDPAALAYVGPSPLVTDAAPPIDLSTEPSPYVQPDRATCGSCCLVLARMINHPEYARTILAPPPDEHVPDVAAHFHADVLAMHELTSSLRDETGRRQLPWPKSLGTHPWAVARRMGEPGGCGVTGSAYAVRYADPGRLDAHIDAIETALSAGHCVPIFIGDGACPRHVLLAVDTEGHAIGVYDPSRGTRVVVGRDAIRTSTIDVAGWDQLWLSILPRRRW